MKATNAVLRNSTILKICVVIACSLALCMGAAQTASAELIFKIQDTTVFSNGVGPTQGVLHGVLQLTGSDLTTPPTNLQSVNIAFQPTNPGEPLSFSLPQEPSSGGLFSGGNLFTGASVLPHQIRFADDAQTPVAGFNNARLVSVPFTVNAGVTNRTIPISFMPGNELGNSAAQALPITLMGGSINVRPFIPEPSTALLALLAGSFVALRRRGR
jgi:hypothetical protein